jgi:membrane protease YdiL (CAAX protease family)
VLTADSSLAAESGHALLGAALTASGLALAPLVIDLGRHWIPERRHFFARWGFTHAALVVLLALAGLLVIPTVASLVGGGEPGLSRDLTLMALVFLGPALLIFRLAHTLDPERLRCLGFRAAGSLRSLLFGLSSYALLFPALFGSMLLWPWVVESLGAEATAQDSVRGFLELEAGQRALPLLLAVFVLPFFEELLFRAFLQPLFVQNFHEVGGVAITSALFAALHGTSVFLPVFVLSLIMGGVMLRTQRFVACWAIHAAHNGLIVSALLYLPAARELVS